MYNYMCVFVCVLCHVYGQGLRVNTIEGLVEGYEASDGKYYEFYGIPYAGPSDREYRFKASVPPTPYSGVFYANDSSILCAQPSKSGIRGVENCLTLNIFTNNVTSLNPVIVFLNAEDYATTPSEAYSFKNLVEQNLVFVSLNFRLSIFGFLCLGIKEAPGNAGLRDVLLGLKWIHANIANFGGDPNNVVLMGHASGAAMVDLITMAPQAKGLVHKAIALSGSALAPWAVAYDPIGYAKLLEAKLGYTSNSTEDLARHLASTESFRLKSALADLLHFKNGTLMFAPCIENISLNPNDTILSDAPINLIRSGSYLQIPYITGFTTREGTMRVNEAVHGNWLSDMNKNFTDFLPADLLFKSAEETEEVVNTTVKHYFKDHHPIVSMKNIDDFLKYEGDTLVVMPVIRGARERSVSSSAELRLIVFGYMGGDNSDWNHTQVPLNGVKHGGLLDYLFNYDLKLVDDSVMLSVLDHFVTFAYTGTQNKSNIFQEWLSIKGDDFNELDIAPSGQKYFMIFMQESRDHLHQETMRLWNEIYSMFYRPPRAVNYSGKPNSTKKVANSFRVIFSSIIMIMISCIL